MQPMSPNWRSIAPLCSHFTAQRQFAPALVYLDEPTLVQISGEDLDAALNAIVDAS